MDSYVVYPLLQLRYKGRISLQLLNSIPKYFPNSYPNLFRYAVWVSLSTLKKYFNNTSIKQISTNKQLAVIGDKLKVKYYNGGRDKLNIEVNKD